MTADDGDLAVQTIELTKSFKSTVALAGVDVVDVEVRRPTLDDVFLSLTGQRLEDDDGEVA